MSFASPLSSTSPYTPVDPMDVIDYGASENHQLPDHQSQWSYHSTDVSHNADISDVIANASEKLLEENPFYMRLKLLTGERAAELNRLQETLANQRKELEALKIRRDTYLETIALFAKGSVALKTASSDTTPVIKLPLTADMNKGETDGSSRKARAKAKPGRPRKDIYEDSISEYFYLQNSDGTIVSKEVISRMSQKAHTIWEILDEHGLAPTTFDKISEAAWDFYARSMLPDPEFFFLQLCDDGQWKLKEWSNSNYSSWYDNRGAQQIDLDDLDPGNGGNENGSDIYCRVDGSNEGYNTETPHSTSNSEKKKKTERKVTSRSPKKQRAFDALNILTDRNTNRNMCMRHELDTYFKTLSDADKEPFKKEMRAAPRATRKARTTVKAGDTLK